MNFSNQTIVVTGATSGIGLAVAELLVGQGAAVIGVGRSAERCAAAEQRLRKLSEQAAGQPVDYLVADLSQQHAVRALASLVGAILETRGATGLDGLVNNAGTFTYWYTLTSDGVEMQWAVNHLAPFLLTGLLLPLLRAAPFGRVVTVSSDSHYTARLNWQDLQLRRCYNGLAAYSNTKLANILFTLELNRRCAEGSGLRAFAADPGLVKTDIGLKGTPALARWIWKLRRSGGIPAEDAAQGILQLLCEPALQDAPDLYWKHGRPKKPSQAAQDADAAKRLWALSQQMCGLPLEACHAC